MTWKKTTELSHKQNLSFLFFLLCFSLFEPGFWLAMIKGTYSTHRARFFFSRSLSCAHTQLNRTGIERHRIPLSFFHILLYKWRESTQNLILVGAAHACRQWFFTFNNRVYCTEEKKKKKKRKEKKGKSKHTGQEQYRCSLYLHHTRNEREKEKVSKSLSFDRTTTVKLADELSTFSTESNN